MSKQKNANRLISAYLFHQAKDQHGDEIAERTEISSRFTGSYRVFCYRIPFHPIPFYRIPY